MNFEIISIGTELLLGQIVNTNARDISQLLSELGMNVYYTTVVGDNPERLSEALENCHRPRRRNYHHRRTRPNKGRFEQGDHRPILRS